MLTESHVGMMFGTGIPEKAIGKDSGGQAFPASKAYRHYLRAPQQNIVQTKPRKKSRFRSVEERELHKTGRHMRPEAVANREASRSLNRKVAQLQGKPHGIYPGWLKGESDLTIASYQRFCRIVKKAYPYDSHGYGRIGEAIHKYEKFCFLDREEIFKRLWNLKEEDFPKQESGHPMDWIIEILKEACRRGQK